MVAARDSRPAAWQAHLRRTRGFAGTHSHQSARRSLEAAGAGWHHRERSLSGAAAPLRLHAHRQRHGARRGAERDGAMGQALRTGHAHTQGIGISSPHICSGDNFPTEDEMIFDHITIGVSDYQRSKAFYTKALAPLGIGLIKEYSSWAGFGRDKRPQFWFGQ